MCVRVSALHIAARPIPYQHTPPREGGKEVMKLKKRGKRSQARRSGHSESENRDDSRAWMGFGSRRVQHARARTCGARQPRTEPLGPSYPVASRYPPKLLTYLRAGRLPTCVPTYSYNPRTDGYIQELSLVGQCKHVPVPFRYVTQCALPF